MRWCKSFPFRLMSLSDLASIVYKSSLPNQIKIGTLKLCVCGGRRGAIPLAVRGLMSTCSSIWITTVDTIFVH